MQAFLSYPAFVLYGIIAGTLAVGVALVRRENRQDEKAEPVYRPRHQVPAYPPLSCSNFSRCAMFDDCPLYLDCSAVPPSGRPGWGPDDPPVFVTESVAAPAAAVVARDPFEPVSFAEWEAGQDAWRTGAQQAATTVWAVLDSRAWADPWWTRSGRLS